MTENTHGGPRPNSGAKPKPDDEKRKMRSYRYAPEICEYLDSCPCKTEAIESAIKASPDYRTFWAKRYSVQP